MNNCNWHMFAGYHLEGTIVSPKASIFPVLMAPKLQGAAYKETTS